MDASPFSSILEDLVARLPGARASALVDREGETVDYAGPVDPFDVKIAAAHLRILLVQWRDVPVLGDAGWLILRSATKSFYAAELEEGYALIVLFARGAGFVPRSRALAVCRRGLAREAGFQHVVSDPWFAIDVEVDAHERPRRLFDRGRSFEVEVLGAHADLPAHEHGFRLRTDGGNELTVVRERGGFWYADEPPEGVTPSVRIGPSSG